VKFKEKYSWIWEKEEQRNRFAIA